MATHGGGSVTGATTRVTRVRRKKKTKKQKREMESNLARAVRRS